MRRKPYADFPEVVVIEGPPSFAHDRGTQTPVMGWEVAGVPTEAEDVLEALVRHRKGWGAEGSFDDAAVTGTVERFVMANAYLQEPTPEVHGGPVPFAPPRTRFVDVEGRRWVVFTGIRQSGVSNRGAHFERTVRVFDARTGAAPDELPPGIPEVVRWTETDR